MNNMKLYTEEEIRRTFGFGLNEIHFKGFMNAMTPILLPSDEEIKKMALEKYRDVEYTRGDEMIQFGAKWVIKQIKNQQK